MKDSTLVYSTEMENTCPTCGKALKKCSCGSCKPVTKKTVAKKPEPKRDGIVRVSRETKGRKGSGVTLVTGLPLTLDQIRDLAKQLKQKCGSGGTVKDAVIEIQGEHRDTVVEELLKLGYNVKRSGG